MRIIGLSSIKLELEQSGYFVKCIVNQDAVVFFSSRTQHRDMKREGLSYEDDYQGNAMAAVIKPNKIEVRFHSLFNDAQVKKIFQEILAIHEMSWAKNFVVVYQGRTLLGEGF